MNEYEKKAIEVVKRFNAGQGNITDLCKQLGIGRSTFYENRDKLGIKKQGDKYIIPDKLLQLPGQYSLLEDTEPKESIKHMKKEEKQPEGEISSQRIQEKSEENIKPIEVKKREEGLEVSEMREESQEKPKVGRPARKNPVKKLTIEIDETVYKALKFKQVAESITINRYIEQLLRQDIEELYFAMVDKTEELSGEA